MSEVFSLNSRQSRKSAQLQFANSGLRSTWQFDPHWTQVASSTQNQEEGKKLKSQFAGQRRLFEEETAEGWRREGI